MTICALILAHHKPKLLGRLVSRLKRAGVEAVVHVDGKIDEAPFRDTCEGNGARFVDKRVEVSWGGFSMVQATANLAAVGLEDQNHTHFYHISGDTYPIVPDGLLIELLTQNYDFIDNYEAKPGTQAYKRISQTFLPDTRIGSLLHGLPHEERYVTSDVVNAFADIARVQAMKASRSFPWRYAKGANWWGFRRASLLTCLSVLSDRPDFVDWFRYASNPDESFFNSAALNFLDAGQCKPCPVLSVWNVVPAPYEFKTVDDMHHFSKTNCVFARKFSPDAIDLLALLDAPQ